MTDKEVLFLRSSKKDGNKLTEEDSCTNDDIWDDTLLIKAYDKAVQIAQESYTKNKQNADDSVNSKGKKGGEQKWKIGDKCRCQYSQDLRYYEADIIEISGSTGMCNVRYVGYENEEKVPLKKLKPSKGETARNKQLREAVEDNGNSNDMEVEADTMGSAGEKSWTAQKKKSSESKKGGYFKKKNGFNENKLFNSLNFPLPLMENSMIPPPPPPHMFSRLSEDEDETEAMSAMLISWYMSGYHTGYYQGLKKAKKQ